jgi:hypothetical protein
MNTRKRVVDYLCKNRYPVSFNSIRYLGTDSPIVRWESVVAIVKDLESEGLVTVNIIKAGESKAFMVMRNG